jgi:twinkle protein
MDFIKQYSDVQGEIDSLYDTGLIKGETIGFQDVDKLISFKKGATSYIYGTPASGKSEFWWECLINLSKSKGWKHLIFSPETGTPAEIFAEIIHKWAGKPFFDLDGNKLPRLTKQEMYRYGAEVSQYFYIMDLGVKDITLDDFHEAVEKYGVKFDTVTTDPFNEVKHDLKGEQRDMYMARVLGKIRMYAREYNYHHTIIMHIARETGAKVIDDATGIKYYPPADPRFIDGGETSFRKGEQMICVWRPPFGVSKDGNPYQGNEVKIIVQKTKPKGIGEIGEATLFFDKWKNCYYEEINGIKSYAGNYVTFEKPKILPF